jgi:hypothetical protein
MIVGEIGQPDRRGNWKCPFHADENPSLHLRPDGKSFGCWSCEASGSPLDWIMLRRRVDIIGAACEIDPSLAELIEDRKPAKPPAPPPVAAPFVRPDPRPEPWRDPEWQAAVGGIIERAEARLWSSEGRAALEWLCRRGLADHTIRRFRLGFIARDEKSGDLDALADREKPRIYAPRGVTLPWVAPGAWYSPTEAPDGPRWVGLNVRRLMPNVADPWPSGDKYLLAAGSRRGCAYPLPDLTPGVVALIVEGDMDALIALQEIGHIVNVVTVGGALQRPLAPALRELAGCPTWLLATDMDDAGDKAERLWRRIGADRCRRLLLPTKDVGDFVAAGGDLSGWVRSEGSRLAADPLEPDRDWRRAVANLPTDRWIACRRSGEIQAALGHRPTAPEIVEADRSAAAKMGVPGADDPTPGNRMIAALAAVPAARGDAFEDDLPYDLPRYRTV